ncbi:uncharacterized protein LOC122295178 isoform X13 [Carya illinoinensis]|uniref:uncharacterized protein LOC122295178 isoform X13 n=1 Tax=Carya illinoinensis TaxID=32201 RepID=UPI001C723F27|nr:uncharacterized protein LOC122295178 isoform X13 [Carya illinoinensis]
MAGTGIKHLWKGTLVDFDNLKELDMGDSENLIETSDLSGAPNPEIIDFQNCRSLCEVHPSIKELKQLKELSMIGTGIKHLWKGTLVVLHNLKILNLSDCKNLIETPDLTGTPNLEEIYFIGCTNLREVHPSIKVLKQIQKIVMGGTGIKHLWKGTLVVLHNLKILDLTNCKNLIELPDLTGAQNLEEIYITGCTSLCEVHPSIKVLKQIQKIIIIGTGIKQLWKGSLMVLYNLKILNLSNCKNLIETPDLTGTPNLEEIYFIGCTNLREVHPSIKVLKQIQKIVMAGTGIKHLWKGTLVVLHNLKILDLTNCKNLIELPDLTGAQNLEEIYITGCTSLCEVHPSIKVLKQIQKIIIIGIGIKQLWKGSLMVLHNLKILNLSNCKNLIETPDLTGTPNLEETYFIGCTNLREVHPSIKVLKQIQKIVMGGTGIKHLWKGTLVVLHNLKILDLINCKNLIELPDLTGAQNLEEIYITGCTSLCEVHPSIKVLKQIQKIIIIGTEIKQLWKGPLMVLHNLKILNLSNCKNLIETPDLTRTPNLEEIYFIGCTNLREVHPSIKVLKQIQKIVMAGTGIKHLWKGTLVVLHNLKILDLTNCKNLIELPDLTGAQNLEEIYITGCTSLCEVHPSIKVLKQIQKIIIIGTGIKQLWNGSLMDFDNLKELDMGDSENLIETSDLSGAPNPEIIDFQNCRSLCEVHPSIKELKQLKELSMIGTGIKHLWKGTLVDFDNLKELDMGDSENLIETSDLSGAPNPEIIDFQNCRSLCEVHPSIKELKQLKELSMIGTGIKHLWKGTLVVLHNLKILNLSDCKNLIETPDLTGTPNLEEIYFIGCTNLREVHPSIKVLKQIQKIVMGGTGIKHLWKGTLVVLHNLKILDLTNCKNLIELPDLTGAQNLEEIYITGCTSLCEVHPSIKVLKQIQKIIIIGTGIKQLWKGSLMVLYNLKILNLSNCKNLIETPDLTGTPNLEEIYFIGCTNLREVHPSIKVLKQIQKIVMAGTGIKHLWKGTLVVLHNLKILDLTNCKNLIELPDLTRAQNLEEIYITGCTSLCEVHPSIKVLKQIQKIIIIGTGIKQLWKGSLMDLDNLKELDMGDSENLIETPDLSGAPNLEIIDFQNCRSLCEVHPSIKELKQLKELSMIGTGIKQLWKGTLVGLDNLKILDLSDCKNLIETPDLSGTPNLEEIYFTGCTNLCEVHPSVKVLKQIQKIIMAGTGIKHLWKGTSVGLDNLKILDLGDCKNLIEIPDLTGAQNLEEIYVTGCLSLCKVHPSIKVLKQIQKIIMAGTGIKQLWKGSLMDLDNLKELDMGDSENLIETPDLSGAPNLEIIDFQNCRSLCEVHPSIKELKQLKELSMIGTGIKQLWNGTLVGLDILKILDLGDCKNLIETPDLSGIPNLEEIYFTGCTNLCEVHPSIKVLKQIQKIIMAGTGIKHLWKGTSVGLDNLKILDLGDCKNLIEIPDLTGAQNLEEIYVTGCLSLCKVHPSIKVLKQIQKIIMAGTGIKQLWEGTLVQVLQNLKILDLSNCKNLIEIPDLTGAQNLEEIYLTGCTNLCEDHRSMKVLKQRQKIKMVG